MDDEVVEEIDGAVHMGHLSCLIESKHQAEAVSIGPIAKMRNQLLRRHPGTIGLIFSVSGFTRPALTLAQYLAPQLILLWIGSEIDRVFEDARIGVYLDYKYRKCMEEGLADTDINFIPSRPKVSGAHDEGDRPRRGEIR